MLLTTLPNGISRLGSLRYINLRANQLRDFPSVLCQLENLEILDISRNKIAKMPDKLGGLISLKVLSLSRNRITELPRYIGKMGDLKILKIEHNPITWPPLTIVSEDPEMDAGKWLNRLKDFLNSESHPQQPKKIEGSSKPLKSDPTKPGRTPPSQPTASTLRECDALVDYYLSNRHPLGSPKDQSTSQKLVEVGRSMMWTFARIVRSVKQVRSTLPDNAATIIFERDVIDMNKKTLKLVAILVETDESDSLATTDPQLVSRQIERLRVVANNAVASCRKLFASIQANLPILFKKADPYVIRTFLASCIGTNAELALCIRTLDQCAKQKEVKPVDRLKYPLQSELGPAVLAMAETAGNAMRNVVAILQNKDAITMKTTDLQKQASSNQLRVLRDKAQSVTTSLLDSLHLFHEAGTGESQNNFNAQVQNFVNVVVPISTFLQEGSVVVDQRFRLQLLAHMQVIIRSTKELMSMLLTS
ncbi:hypothetical protein BJ742DRAFT_507352 [Cladochytrium replicatum]|nr:hypothetical protein BJ742DRAFT_507352 [Cladochytrium replicatum]